MGNNTQTAWTHALDGEALRAWLDFDAQRLGGGCLRWDWVDDRRWAQLLLKKTERGGDGWLVLDEFWIEGEEARLATSSDSFGAAGWPKMSLLSGAALAFCGGFCDDEGIGHYWACTRIEKADFNQVAAEIGSTGAFFTKKWAVEKMTSAQAATIEKALISFYGKEGLAGMGFDKERMRSRAEPKPWGQARGWGAVVESRRGDIVGAKKAADWLLPFCSLLGEAPPQWLVDQAGVAGAKRALSTALLAGNMEAVKMLAPKVELSKIDGEDCVRKAFRMWSKVFQNHNQHPQTLESISQKRVEALAIFEAAALGEDVAMATRQQAPKSRRNSI